MLWCWLTSNPKYILVSENSVAQARLSVNKSRSREHHFLNILWAYEKEQKAKQQYILFYFPKVQLEQGIK